MAFCRTIAEELLNLCVISQQVLGLCFKRQQFLLGVLSHGKTYAIQESHALTDMSSITEGDERNIILLRLVEYLGHTNQVICGLAYDEVFTTCCVYAQADIRKIRRVANHLNMTPMRLFAPYWRTIATAVVNDLLKRPQVVQQMADLLAITVADFLIFTQTFTTPYLILTKKRDILQRIADSSGRSPKQLCMDHSNLAATLACILLQESEDIESMIMALFSNISPEFAKIHYTDLLKAEQPLTAAELLKAATEDDDSSKQKVGPDYLSLVATNALL